MRARDALDRFRGRYLVIGFPAGIPRLPLNLTLLKNCGVCGIFWGAFAEREPEAHRRNMDQLLAWWDAGGINPPVGKTWPLERAARLSHGSRRGR